MAAYRIAVPLSHENQLPLLRFYSTAVHESSCKQHYIKYPDLLPLPLKQAGRNATQRNLTPQSGETPEGNGMWTLRST